MKKVPWFAHPWLSVLLAVSWLLLQHTLAPFHLISAVLIGLLVPRLLHNFLPATTTLRFAPALRLALVVLWDIVVSNFTVARLVLGPMSRPQPAWVRVPLALSHPTAISVLASIITTTPGTVSCLIDEERKHILVHALDCSDPLQMAADIKARYENPLLAIFEPRPDTPGASP
ncbi:MAG: Na+/H+ antiporter subunit E [Polaromonas sp.]|uniref:Na+/H+ antiporter subunit E n=1 Tax=Polaromonas sp. TaxID=1869339 RepID=UPI0027303D77|nr:Na+/H+ antiporter subunit E [Polaromonas sp.]MDP2449002.1 Na+/H+ antiporter subunit E [Polaromonas sp.]MDP3248483.1 Na+/H+ antiporter subunit E [Polaromonas sp.]MDP3757159.1 Na+/H+ antiporter subunit E [Polaromonas sp.]MDP3826928.1 Na+/H+ antiporter subunit E [Polaromonas sp.]